MSEDNDYKPMVNNKFEKDKLLEYFTNHTNKKECPECGYADFDIVCIGGTNENEVVVDGVTLRSLPDGHGFIMFNKMHMQLICSNCGYIKLYDLTVIHNKINELYNGK